MREKTYIWPAFFSAFACVGVLYIVGSLGFLGFLTSALQQVFFPISTFVVGRTGGNTSQSEILQLKKENLILSEQLVSLKDIAADNKALRDQFQTEVPSSHQLLPVAIVGLHGAIPNITFPETLVVGAGQKEGVRLGSVVVVQNNLIGLATQVTAHFSVVTLISNKSSSFSVRDTASGAIGIVRGQGSGQLVLDNVLLSDTLHTGDFLESLGSQDSTGAGIPPGLIVGKISSVEKNPSNLFQSANIVPLIDDSHLATVFIFIH